MTGKKVLVIDDSHLIRLEVRRTLEKYSIEILELDNAEDFFESAWRFQDLALLILDVFLPGMDGLAALEKLRADKKWAYLPVIMLTGRADKNSVRRALQAGAVNYICKPFSREEIIERVETVLGPIVPIDNNNGGDSQTAMLAQIRQEINRAKRGKYTVLLLETKIPDELREFSRLNELKTFRTRIKEALRETDHVSVTKERNLLLILPFSEGESTPLITARISQYFKQFGSKELKFASAIYPGDGIDEETLLQALQGKISNTQSVI